MLSVLQLRIDAERNGALGLHTLFESLLHHLMTSKVRPTSEFIRQFEAAPSEAAADTMS
jgi:hypothetical protein